MKRLLQFGEEGKVAWKGMPELPDIGGGLLDVADVHFRGAFGVGAIPELEV